MGIAHHYPATIWSGSKKFFNCVCEDTGKCAKFQAIPPRSQFTVLSSQSEMQEGEPPKQLPFLSYVVCRMSAKLSYVVCPRSCRLSAKLRFAAT